MSHKARILITGGAGYIGSHMAKYLSRRGFEVVVFDNLSTGFRRALGFGRFVEGDLADGATLARLFTDETPVQAVIHFAASSQVGGSVRTPGLYYRNNVAGTIGLLDAMVRAGCRTLVFSSTAAIFGEPLSTLIDETHPQCPINPYGRSKRMVEEILADYERAHGVDSVCLRYFNAAGADPEGELGECHCPETHLIPLVLQTASGRRPEIEIFGADYPTHDGTCIRDYIHVEDLCAAHLLALEHLLSGGGSRAYNLGNGHGHSVREVIDAARRVTGCEFPVRESERREGDPAALVADSGRAIRELHWCPQRAALDTILLDAWRWETGGRWQA